MERPWAALRQYLQLAGEIIPPGRVWVSRRVCRPGLDVFGRFSEGNRCAKMDERSARSSVGQSIGFLIRRSQVRVLPGAVPWIMH